jgi:hypothetical protein
VGVVARLVVVAVRYIAVGPSDEAKKSEDGKSDEASHESWKWQFHSAAFCKIDDVVHETPCLFQITLGKDLRTNVAVTTHNPLGAGQFWQTHWSAGVKLLCGDADLSTKTEFATIGEAG